RVSLDDIAPRYLGRGFTAEEGVPPAAVDDAQRRLGVRIPASLAYYYQRAGGCTVLNALHHRLYAPSELLIDGGYLVFMDENQTVVSWGFRTTDCGEDEAPAPGRRLRWRPCQPARSRSSQQIGCACAGGSRQTGRRSPPSTAIRG